MTTANKTIRVSSTRNVRKTAGGTIVLPDGSRLVWDEKKSQIVHDTKPTGREVPDGWHETTIEDMRVKLNLSRSAAQGIMYVLLEKGLARIVGRSHQHPGAKATRGPGVVVYELRDDWATQDLSKLPTVKRTEN